MSPYDTRATTWIEVANRVLLLANRYISLLEDQERERRGLNSRGPGSSSGENLQPMPAVPPPPMRIT